MSLGIKAVFKGYCKLMTLPIFQEVTTPVTMAVSCVTGFRRPSIEERGGTSRPQNATLLWGSGCVRKTRPVGSPMQGMLACGPSGVPAIRRSGFGRAPGVDCGGYQGLPWCVVRWVSSGTVR